MGTDNHHQRLARLGLRLPRLHLPVPSVDLRKWAVIACDQFTNDSRYWESLAGIVGEEPSTLHYIIPEAHLETMDTADTARSVRQVQQRMRRDIADGILREVSGAMWVRRTFCDGSNRDGLLFAVDLERYHYQREPSALIQATEQTFVARTVLRRDIRAEADLELPHILVFYNDPTHSVRAALQQEADTPPLYHTELMRGGGEVLGREVGGALEGVIGALERLRPSVGTALFFVGDGNHSLAAAKEHWNALRSGGAADTHPARHALVELINIHDPGVKFEPIHKYIAIQGAQEQERRAAAALFAALEREATMASAASNGRDDDRASGRHGETRHGETRDSDTRHGDTRHSDTRDSDTRHSDTRHGREHPRIVFHHAGRTATHPTPRLPADVILQRVLSRVAVAEPTLSASTTLLFAHGIEELQQLQRTRPGVAVEMPALDRNAILRYITTDGVLPKKSFSLGYAEEKRYYIECRKITA